MRAPRLNIYDHGELLDWAQGLEDELALIWSHRRAIGTAEEKLANIFKYLEPLMQSIAKQGVNTQNMESTSRRKRRSKSKE